MQRVNDSFARFFQPFLRRSVLVGINLINLFSLEKYIAHLLCNHQFLWVVSITDLDKRKRRVALPVHECRRKRVHQSVGKRRYDAFGKTMHEDAFRTAQFFFGWPQRAVF